MLESIAKRRLDHFEREWDYDVTYLREMLNAGGIEALAPMQAAEKLSSYRRDIPIAAYFAAKLVAARHGDCGPCLQLGVKMAERAGVSPEIIRNALQHNVDALPEDVALAIEFAESSLNREPSAAVLREAIVQRWGKRALISLSYAIAGTLFYPVFKYVFGYGHACSIVQIGSEAAPVHA